MAKWWKTRNSLGAMINSYSQNRGTEFGKWILAAIFCYAGWLKLEDPVGFADSIASFQLLASFGISYIAIGLPVAELLCAVLLVLGWPKRLGLACVIAMTSVFVVALVSAIARSLPVNCGGFGSQNSSHIAPAFALAQAVLLLGLVSVLYLKECHREAASLARAQARESEPAESDWENANRAV